MPGGESAYAAIAAQACLGVFATPFKELWLLPITPVVFKPMPLAGFLWVVLLVALPAWGVDGVSLSGGTGARGQDHDAYRVGVRRAWGRRWLERDCCHVTGYWDLSLSFWHNDARPGSSLDDADDDLYAVALAPVLRLQFVPVVGPAAPFAELGVGAAYLSDDTFRSGERRSRQLGSHFQFENRGVLGLRFPAGAKRSFEIAYQRMHYSNLNLASDNQGIDVHLLMLGMQF